MATEPSTLRINPSENSKPNSLLVIKIRLPGSTPQESPAISRVFAQTENSATDVVGGKSPAQAPKKEISNLTIVSSTSNEPSPTAPSVEKLNDKFDYRNLVLVSPRADESEIVDIVGIEPLDVGSIEDLIQAFDEDPSISTNQSGSIETLLKRKRGRPPKSVKAVPVSTKLLVDSIPSVPETPLIFPKKPAKPLWKAPRAPRASRSKRNSAGKPPRRYLPDEDSISTTRSRARESHESSLRRGYWKPHEDSMLRELESSGLDLGEISAELNRPVNAIRLRLHQLSIPRKKPITLESLMQNLQERKDEAKRLFKEREILWHFPLRQKELALVELEIIDARQRIAYAQEALKKFKEQNGILDPLDEQAALAVLFNPKTPDEVCDDVEPSPKRLKLDSGDAPASPAVADPLAAMFLPQPAKTVQEHSHSPSALSQENRSQSDAVDAVLSSKTESAPFSSSNGYMSCSSSSESSPTKRRSRTKNRRVKGPDAGIVIFNPAPYPYLFDANNDDSDVLKDAAAARAATEGTSDAPSTLDVLL
eukprot:TRINITY_DN12480_c0_g1_i1.p1 TRINITY_DN12480_c0_g1~~TRINITY_DN12480_c0_g1_i1.p1  ORF type:complete len:536 (-),score=127.90 TRINITY_DN12480_c0_g1_i1:15-1622(-)